MPGEINFCIVKDMSSKNKNIMKITNRGMVSIPSAFRKKLGLEDGQQVLFIEDEGALRLIPIKDRKELIKSSISSKKMLEIINKTRQEDLEIED